MTSENKKEIEDKLWKAAEKLRGPVSPDEYQDVCLGLLFLKYMSDAFRLRRKELKKLTKKEDSGYYCGDNEEEREYILQDKDEYYKKGIFYVPEEARWEYLVKNATQPGIKKKIDDAMRAIEEENPELKGLLYKEYERTTIPQDSIEGLINTFSDIKLKREGDREDNYEFDVFGRVYEYFILKFGKELGQKGGEFWTPKSVVELMVEAVESKGRVFDPFCGSGGMFVQSKEFIEEHNSSVKDISIYGQEIKERVWRICKMNLALRGMEGDIKLDDSIRNDRHEDLKADRVITNPPFNKSDWGKGVISDDDPRFKYGMPPANNANYAFIQHMLYHLNETGICATVMANGAMSIQNTQGEIRKKIIEDDLLDVVIALPKKLFYTTQIPACIFIFAKGKDKDEYRDRPNETLFIDARNMYKKVDRSHNTLTEDHIQKIASTIRAYRGEEGAGEYEDKKGFCKVAETEDIAENRYIISPGRYVGIKEEEGNGPPFEVKMNRLVTELREEFQKSDKLQERIKKDMEELGF